MIIYNVNFINTKGKYGDIEIESKSRELEDIINALIPEINKYSIAEVDEIFEIEREFYNLESEYEYEE